MAILSKIRERSIFLIIIIGLALFSFVLSGLFKSSNSIFNGTKSNIGEVNGNSISRQEFAKKVDILKSNSGNRLSQIQAVNSVWDNLVRQKIYQTQLNNAGIVIGEKEIWDAIVSMPFIRNNRLFKNKVGLFDENRLKEYLATIQENAKNNPNDTQWSSWLSTESKIRQSLRETTYNNLVLSGLEATLKEAKESYLDKNTKVNAQFVILPYKSIADSLVKISDSEIKEYVIKHKNEFKVDATRDLSYVKFMVKPSKEDDLAVKNAVAKLLNDSEEYSTAAKTTVKVIGFKNTKDDEKFLEENNSDTPLNKSYFSKSRLPKQIADKVFNGKKGDVIGPYKENGFYALTKIVDFKQLPDSVKAKHILISYAGASRSSSNRTEAQAKVTADSILKVVIKNKSKFGVIAKELSADKGSTSKGGSLGWFSYTTMVPTFRDFVFFHKAGKIGIVKSQFGYHIIYIEKQKGSKKAVQLATFTRKVEASDNTENKIFQEVETFASNLASGKDINELAKGLKLEVRSVVGVKALDENIQGLKNQRTIVNWAFKKKREIGNIKRFDLGDGYTVVVLNNKREKGLQTVGQARYKVTPILRKAKKAKILVKRMTDKTLNNIAKSNNTVVKSTQAISLASPVIGGVGRETGVIGAMISAKTGTLIKDVIGNKGVYAIKVIKKEIPVKLDNYNALRFRLQTNLMSNSYLIYATLKDASTIEDNRALFY